METYVCILLSPDGHIVTVESFEAAKQVDASKLANALARRDSAAFYQLWHNGRKIAAGATEPRKN